MIDSITVRSKKENAIKMAEDSNNFDLNLVASIAKGDESAFEELVKKYQHSVLNTIHRYIGNYSEADDIAQDVFVKVWRNIKSFKGKAKFSTWLYRIVVNQCLDYRRKNKRKIVEVSFDNKIEESKIPESLTTGTDFEQKKRESIIKQAINELPDNQRIAIILAKYEAKSYQEIADIMDVSLSNVASIIYRAKENLKVKLLPLREKGEI
jgi:RNA polymerase sigma-70 factor (ECF subfamily)